MHRARDILISRCQVVCSEICAAGTKVFAPQSPAGLSTQQQQPAHERRGRFIIPVGPSQYLRAKEHYSLRTWVNRIARREIRGELKD
jgi:hypothetical protein